MLKYHSLRDKVFSLKKLYSAFKHVKKNKGKSILQEVTPVALCRQSETTERD